MEGTAKTVLPDTVTEVVTGREDGVRVRELVREGQAASVLIEAAPGARPLVVGSHGHSGFTEAVLGHDRHAHLVVTAR